MKNTKDDNLEILQTNLFSNMIETKAWWKAIGNMGI